MSITRKPLDWIRVFDPERYVDDVLCLWDGPPDSIPLFLNFINSFYSSINFTVEIEGTQISLPDLTISIHGETHFFLNIPRTHYH